MASWETQPRWWYQGTKINMGQTVSGYTDKMILIHYETEIEIDKFDSLADVVTAYDSDPKLEWEFNVEYYDKNDSKWYKVKSSLPYTKSFNSTSCDTSIYLPLKLDYKNRISCKARVSYIRHSPSVGEFGVTWDTDTKYLHGSKNDLSKVSPYSSSFSSFVSSDNKGTTYFYVYPRNHVQSSAFWKDGSTAIAQGNYIDKHITINNVNNWYKQLGIWASWRSQTDCYGTYNSSTNIRTLSVPNLAGSGTISLTTPTADDDDITASWYNKCANACGANTVKGLQDYGDSATYIKASHFTTLATKVTTWS